jgi:hypothetical protein
MRGPDAVRIVVDGRFIAVYGPGESARQVQFADGMDAVLYHVSVERALLIGGWMLEGRLSGPGVPVSCEAR